MVKKISSLFYGENSLSGASLILILTLFLSNVLGVLRDHFLTQRIPTDLLSVYYAAFRIPDFIFNILILGAITSAFIPVFSSLTAQKKQPEAWLVASSIINISIIILSVMSVILFILMPWLVKFVVPGFSLENQALTSQLARIMLASPILFGISYITGGILNSYKRFLAYSFAPLVYNLSIILGTILLAGKFSIYGVAFSVVIGALLHFLVQLPAAIKLGFKWAPIIDLKHWGVKRIALLMIPRAIALGTNQIMLLVFTAIASSIGGYAVAVYNLADNIQTMPMVVFGTSFATAVFPYLTESVTKSNYQDFNLQILKMVKTILYFMVPMTIILILLRMQIVRLILGSGYFEWEQTIQTANTLAAFSLSLVFTGLMPLFSRSFYALHNTKIPMTVTIIGATISIVLGLVLSNKMGVTGLALGYSIGSAFATILIYLLLRKKAGFKNENSLIKHIGKILLAGVVSVITIQQIKHLVGSAVDMDRFWGVATQAIAATIAGLLIYLVITWFLGCDEASSIKHIFKRFSTKTNTDIAGLTENK